MTFPDLSLPPIKQRLYEALRERPRTAEELRAIAGSYHPRQRDPLTEWCVWSHIYQLKKLLRRFGLTVREPAYRYKPYRLEAE